MQHSRRVLLVDDDPTNLKILADALGHKNYVVHTASSGEEALRAVETFDPELVLMDFNMGGMNGLQTLKKFRERQNYVAVIFVSANMDEGLLSECLESGADDFVRKPFRLAELLSRVQVRFRLKDLNDQLRIANEKLKDLAVHDDLTGLYNMRTMYERIENELRRAKRYDRRVGCIMMDIDNFKEVNDENDHLVGSFVIKELGALIRANMRDVDFAARYGGDEFLVVLTETHREGVAVFAERLRAIIEKHTFNDGRSVLKRTCSLGYAVSDPKINQDARGLVRAADHALYRSKEEGRNRVTAAEARDSTKS